MFLLWTRCYLISAGGVRQHSVALGRQTGVLHELRMEEEDLSARIKLCLPATYSGTNPKQITTNPNLSRQENILKINSLIYCIALWISCLDRFPVERWESSHNHVNLFLESPCGNVYPVGLWPISSSVFQGLTNCLGLFSLLCLYKF